MKKFRGEKLNSLPAPIDSKDSFDVELYQQNMLSKPRNDPLSKNNPFRLDTTNDPFAPPLPSFFNQIDDNKNNVKK